MTRRAGLSDPSESKGRLRRKTGAQVLFELADEQDARAKMKIDRWMLNGCEPTYIGSNADGRTFVKWEYEIRVVLEAPSAVQMLTVLEIIGAEYREQIRECRHCANAHPIQMEGEPWQVVCDDCGLSGPHASSPRLGVRFWNDMHRSSDVVSRADAEVCKRG